MANAIIVHGKPGEAEYYDGSVPSCSNNHWLPWLQKQLLVNNIFAITPEMPNAYKPHYQTWKKEFERFDITPETVLVGHSCGGGFIIRWLSENSNVKVGKVVLVAPSLGKDWVTDDFFEFEIDPNLASRTDGLVIFGSDDDKPGINDAIKTLNSVIKNVTFKEFPGYGHFTLNSMGTTAFPELLETLLFQS